MRRMLRGDERASWELRLAMDLGADASNFSAATTLFERAARAIEGGSSYAAWSKCALAAAPAATHLDIHWSAAIANPTAVAEPWLAVGLGLLDLGRGAEAIEPCAHGVAALSLSASNRNMLLARLEASWNAANLDIPFDAQQAELLGTKLLKNHELARAIPTLRWASAQAPERAAHSQRLALAYCQIGHARHALRALGPAHHDAPAMVARMLLDCGRTVESFAVMQLAARRFHTLAEWIDYAQLALLVEQNTIAADASRHAIKLGARNDQTLLTVYATALARSGEFAAGELEARRLLSHATTDQTRQLAAIALARSLAGQRRFDEAATLLQQANRVALTGAWANDVRETSEAIAAGTTLGPRVAPATTAETHAALQARTRLAHSEFDALTNELRSADGAVFRAALAAHEYRGSNGSNVVANHALDAAILALARSEGSQQLDVTLARIAALRIRENAFIQIDPPPPLGEAIEPTQFEHWYAERLREPRTARPT